MRITDDDRKITIVYHKQKSLDGMIDIESDEYVFRFCDTGRHHGVQSSFYKEKDDILLRLLSEISIRVREIENLSSSTPNPEGCDTTEAEHGDEAGTQKDKL